MVSRRVDKHGSGQFGASRNQGQRSHRGLDIVTRPGEVLFSPIDATLVREGRPYGNDARLKLVELKGEGNWKGVTIKVFYVKGLISGRVRAGQAIGYAQDLTKKYKDITNHIHVEVLRDGVYINPKEIWSRSF